MKYRAIRPGEPIPNGVPQRIVTKKGYVRLRWNLGNGVSAEIFEHRLVMGNPDGVDVHHKNGDKRDNRAENLELIAHGAHSRLHNSSKLDVATIAAEYAGGATLPRLAKRFGVHSSTLSRLLRRRGVAMRKAWLTRRIKIDTGALVRLHEVGVSLRGIADALNTTEWIVRSRAKQLGLPSRPIGRPRKEGEGGWACVTAVRPGELER